MSAVNTSSPRVFAPSLPCRRHQTTFLICKNSIRVPRSQLARASSTGAGKNGGGVLVLPGFLFSSEQYTGLVQDMRAKGFDTEVVPMSVSDWFPVLYGASFEWYLQRLDALLCDMHARHGRVALVGHSAGGWLARILLGAEPYQGVRYARSAWVHTLLTLGTPHSSIENYPFGRAEECLTGPNIDAAPPGVRGSSLQFANHFYPDAASLGGVRVVCACGSGIRGRPLWGPGSSSGGSNDSSNDSSGGGSSSSDGSMPGSLPAASSLGEGSGFGRALMGGVGRKWDAYLAHEGYKSGCGRGDVDGDGVTPLCIAQLPGAEQLVLPGVWHLPRGRKDQPWYGDSPVQDLWLPYLEEQSAA